MPRFHIQLFLLELQSTNSSYSHRQYHGSVFAFNYIQFQSIYIYTHTIHAELKIMFRLSPTLINTFTFIFFNSSGTDTREYRSSTVLQLSRIDN